MGNKNIFLPPTVNLSETVSEFKCYVEKVIGRTIFHFIGSNYNIPFNVL